MDVKQHSTTNQLRILYGVNLYCDAVVTEGLRAQIYSFPKWLLCVRVSVAYVCGVTASLLDSRCDNPSQ